MKYSGNQLVRHWAQRPSLVYFNSQQISSPHNPRQIIALDVERFSQNNLSTTYQHSIEWELELQNQDGLELHKQNPHLIQDQRHVILPQLQIQEQQIQEQQTEWQEDPLWEKELQEQIESLYWEESQKECLDELEVQGYFCSDQSHRFHHIQLEQQTDWLDFPQSDRELLEANLLNGIETQNDQMLASIASQMVESQYQLNKTTLLGTCDLEVYNEL